MFRCPLFSAFLTSLICVAAVGCGGSEVDTPSKDELTQFLEDNPQIVKESKEREEQRRLEALNGE